MNIEDLRSDWSNQWNAETSKEIVLKLFRESRESKIQRVLRNQMLHGLFFMFFNLMVMVFTSIVFVEELHNPALSIAAFAMTSLSTVVFYKNVAQLNLLRRIDFSDSILQLQTTVERLKLKRIRHNRFIFVFCLLYFWLAVAILSSTS